MLARLSERDWQIRHRVYTYFVLSLDYNGGSVEQAVAIKALDCAPHTGALALDAGSCLRCITTQPVDVNDVRDRNVSRSEPPILMVCDGTIDASAIDFQVLALELRDNPDLAAQLKIIDILGPAAIQPVVIRRDVPYRLLTRQ